MTNRFWYLHPYWAWVRWYRLQKARRQLKKWRAI